MMGNPEKQWMMKWGTPISGNRHMIVTVTDAKSSKVTCGRRPFETNFGCSWHMLSLSASLQWFLLRICADGSGSVCIGNASQHSQVKCGLGASKHIQTMQKQTWLIMMLKKVPVQSLFSGECKSSVSMATAITIISSYFFKTFGDAVLFSPQDNEVDIFSVPASKWVNCTEVCLLSEVPRRRKEHFPFPDTWNLQ